MVLPPEKARCGHFASWTYFQGGKERCIGCERDALRSEVERLTKANKEAEQVFVDQLSKTREAEQRAERLERALEKYSAHLPRCKQGSVSQYAPCTCGLEQALRGEE